MMFGLLYYIDLHIPYEVKMFLNTKIGRLSICNFLMIAPKPAGGGVETQMPSGEGAFGSANPVS
jgi:hypothetical protein